MLHNYNFVIDKVLAGCALPGYLDTLQADLGEAHRDGVRAVVTLTERGLDKAAVAEMGMKYLHLPIADYEPPTIAQMEEFCRFVDGVRAEGGAVLVHCRAGIGRTGTMLAAYLVHEGRSASDAAREVRRHRPGSIETRQQERILDKFEEVLRKYPRGEKP